MDFADDISLLGSSEKKVQELTTVIANKAEPMVYISTQRKRKSYCYQLAIAENQIKR